MASAMVMQSKDAISISKVDDGVVVVASPMVAALIYSSISLSWAFAIVALLNFLAFAMQRCIRTKYEAGDKSGDKKLSVWQDFKQGLWYIRRDRFLRGFIPVPGGSRRKPRHRTLHRPPK